MRQGAIVKLSPDGEADGGPIHGYLSGGSATEGRARFTRVVTPEAPTHEAKVQAATYYTRRPLRGRFRPTLLRAHRWGR